MSQNIFIPVAVDYTSGRRRWEVCEARLAGYERDLYPKPAHEGSLPPLIGKSLMSLNTRVAFHIDRRHVYRALVSSAVYVFLNPAEDDVIENRFAPGGKLREDEEANKPFNIVACFDDSPSQPHSRDPWAMRQEFLELGKDLDALAQFLSKWGSWDYGILQKIDPFPELLPAKVQIGSQRKPNYVFPEHIWEAQVFFRNALTRKPARWLAQHAKLPGPHRIDGPPYFGMTDQLCISAIHTTITLDHLRNVEYRICARADCGKPFRVESAHGQTYCSYRCAHTVNMRQLRKAQRKQANKKATGA